MTKRDDYITRKDLHEFGTELKKGIVDDISSVLADAMTNIGENFQNLQQDVTYIKKDLEDVKAGQNRVEQKLDPTINQVDDHEVRLRKLERKAA